MLEHRELLKRPSIVNFEAAGGWRQPPAAIFGAKNWNFFHQALRLAGLNLDE
jgi:hypothetical protein